MTAAPPIPADLQAELLRRSRAGWTGSITLNVKSGRIIEYAIMEKHRIDYGPA